MSLTTSGSLLERVVARVAVCVLVATGLTVGTAVPALASVGPCAHGEYAGDATVTFDGDPTVGAPVTATFVPGTDWTSRVDPADVRFTWTGVGLSRPVTGPTFTARPDLVGAPVHVAVAVSDGNAEDPAYFAADCDLGDVGWGTLGRPGVPTISGDSVVGGMLVAHPNPGDSFRSAARYHVEWFVTGVSSAVATGRRIVLGPTLAGRNVSIKVMVTGLGYTDSHWSGSSAAFPVATGTPDPGQLTAPSAITISGTPRVGSPLTAVATGSWTPGTHVSYVWKADGATFGTDADTVTPTAAQAGSMITVEATGSLPGYATRTVASPAVGPVDAGTSGSTPGRPSISGSARVGQVLTAAPATDDPDWPAGTTYRYQWYADGDPFATGDQVTLGAAQLGRAVTVRALVSVPGQPDSDLSAPSAPTPPVSAGQLSTPTGVAVSGSARVGERLTATVTGRWTPGTDVAFVWRADGVRFGDDAARVVLSADELGKRITVTASGALAGYRPAKVTSGPTARVDRGVLTAPRPQVRGTADVGRTLTVRPGTWTDGATLGFQWYADGVAIRGATGRDLDLTRRLRHQRITVRVTGRLDGYRTVTRTSRPTPEVG